MSSRITKKFTFDAAHHLPYVPADHKCARPHGHTYGVIIGIEGDIDPDLGWVTDFTTIKKVFAPLLEQLDHHDLNQIAGLENPTSEIVARWIFTRLAPQLPGLADVTVQETPSTTATYRP